MSLHVFLQLGLRALLPAALAPPHLFMILVDDLGYHNVGFHNPDQVSPHINTLVQAGIRLEGHYTFQFCSPTRSSFLSGRLPIHVNMEQPSPGSSPGGIDLRMTLISQVLKSANYSTHFIGKGHIGAYSHANLPINRGFDSHLGFLGGGEDHFTQRAGALVDLWRDHGPAHGENGTYSCDLYGGEVQKVIAAHEPSKPLFVYLPMHDTHSPYECTAKWMDPRVQQPLRQLMQCMLTCVDDVTGKVVAGLQAKGMWQNSLLVWSADNGGPQYWGSNNYPLRGGKGTDFQVRHQG
jgi:arylsulfatase B